jgi:choline kinase
VRAIILAAGEGARLRPYTLDRPKCLVELGGKPLLVQQIDVLKRAGIKSITVLTGYRAEQIEALGYPTHHNPDYAHTNMVATLMCSAGLLNGGDDVLIAYSDILYEPRIIEALCACPEAMCATVDTLWLELWRIRMEDALADAETLKLDDQLNVIELGKKPLSLDDIQGQYMGLVKLRADFAPTVVDAYKQMDRQRLYDGHSFENMYMTSFLQYLIGQGHPLKAVCVKNGWLEIDTVDDLMLYKQMYERGTLEKYCRL